eukprot:Hpha_TRINITY_DN15222_c5_g3::TRINITY_DN15222_c5_g3_i1::g.66839::m.66839
MLMLGRRSPGCRDLRASAWRSGLVARGMRSPGCRDLRLSPSGLVGCGLGLPAPKLLVGLPCGFVLWCIRLESCLAVSDCRCGVGEPAGERPEPGLLRFTRELLKPLTDTDPPFSDSASSCPLSPLSRRPLASTIRKLDLDPRRSRGEASGEADQAAALPVSERLLLVREAPNRKLIPPPLHLPTPWRKPIKYRN